MNKRTRTFVLCAVLTLGAGWAAAPARCADGPAASRRVRPEASSDAALESAIRSALGGGGEGGGEPTRYNYNRVDLDGDGRPEALVYVYGPAWCGSAGCTLLVFKREGGGYRLVSHVSGAENPVVVSDRRTNGWRDLIAHVRWGEVEGRTVRDYFAVLHFDGQTYPDQFPGAQPLGATEGVRGVAYFAGGQSARSGFVLRSSAGRPAAARRRVGAGRHR
ncbi:MAG TPA: hypothetical protein VEY09_15265 [Pyrinomonadaceae bacterium]|nr:hypothetical protein [Pyrinomonadaceae bacterium]